jgi:hypothetical protein
LTAISTRPNLLFLAVWEGASGRERERFSGIKQVVAMFLDMLYFPLLEQLVVDARAFCCGPQSSCYQGSTLSYEIEEEMRRDLMEDILWCLPRWGWTR